MSRWGFSESQWEAMAAHLRALLIDAARSGGTVTYGEIARTVFEGRVLARSSAVMALVDDACDEADEAHPGTIMASLVVRADTGMPGEGYFQWAADHGYDTSDRTRLWRAQAEAVWVAWRAEEVDDR